jgi:hypothetical protein
MGRHADRAARLAALLALPASLVACDGDQASSQAPGEHDSPIRSACAELARTWCENTSICRSATFSSQYGDIATCVERHATSCERTQFGNGSGMTPDGIRSCAAAWESELSSKPVSERCRLFVRREAERNPPIACVTSGTLPDDASCLTGDQCQIGSCRPGLAPCGICRKLEEPGGPCFENGDCSSGLACAGFRCAPYGGVSATCDALKPCHPDLICFAGSCAERHSEGDPCTPDSDECALWPDELACGPNGVCQRPALAGAGESCGDRTDGSVALCEHGFVCRAAGPNSGVCVPVGEDRSPCSVFALTPKQVVQYSPGGPCEAPAICLEARCRIPDAATCSPGAPP